MNWTPNFITQSIRWYDGLDDFILFFVVFFSRKNCILSLCFLFITAWLSLDTSGATSFLNNFRFLVGLLRLV